MATLSNPRYQNLYEPQDAFEADESFLRNVVAPSPAAAPAPAVAPDSAPASATDWMSALQSKQPGWTLQTLQSMPVSAETGEAPGPVEGYLFYDPTKTAVGEQYQRYTPEGKYEGLGQFKEDGNFGDLLEEAAIDLGPLLLTALGMPGAGSLGTMLGTSIAGGLGMTGLSAAQLAALGSAAGGAGLGLAQKQDPLDVLKNAALAGASAFVPSQVSSFLPSTGTPALDAALKKATELGTRVALKGGDVEEAVLGSLVGSGINASSGAIGIDPKLFNTVIDVARSGGDPQKLFNAIVGASSSAPPASSAPPVSSAIPIGTTVDPTTGTPLIVYDDGSSIEYIPGRTGTSGTTTVSDIEGQVYRPGSNPLLPANIERDLFAASKPEYGAQEAIDAQTQELINAIRSTAEPTAGELPSWAIDPYAKEATAPISQPLFPEFEAPLLTTDDAQRYEITAPAPQPLLPEALFPEFEQPLLTIDDAQRYEITGEQTQPLFPEFEAPFIDEPRYFTAEEGKPQTIDVTGKKYEPIYEQPPTPEPEPIYEQPPTPAPTPAPAPGPAPAPAPGPSPAPAPAAKLPDLSRLGGGQATQTRHDPTYFNYTATDLDKLFGYREPSSLDELLAMIGQKPRG